jgi:hypothetical protein
VRVGRLHRCHMASTLPHVAVAVGHCSHVSPDTRTMTRTAARPTSFVGYRRALSARSCRSAHSRAPATTVSPLPCRAPMSPKPSHPLTSPNPPCLASTPHLRATLGEDLIARQSTIARRQLRQIFSYACALSVGAALGACWAHAAVAQPRRSWAARTRPPSHCSAKPGGPFRSQAGPLRRVSARFLPGLNKILFPFSRLLQIIFKLPKFISNSFIILNS